MSWIRPRPVALVLFCGLAAISGLWTGSWAVAAYWLLAWALFLAASDLPAHWRRT